MLIKDKKTSKTYSGKMINYLSNEYRLYLVTDDGQVLTFIRDNIVELPIPDCVGDERKLRRKK